MQTTSRSLLALPLLLALSACGGEEATVIDPELGLDGPATLSIVPGSSLSHDFSLQRNETADGPVSLSIEGLPEGVTASFDPATVAGDAVNTTLRLEAERSATRGVSLVTVRALGGEDLIAERSFALEVRGITVEGRILSGFGSLPPYPMGVFVDGRFTATDEGGRFTVQDVALPYDLVLLGGFAVEVFEGATHPSPTIRSMAMEPLVGGEARIRGTVTPPPEHEETILVCAAAGPVALTPYCAIPSAEGHFEIEVYLSPRATTAEIQVVARRKITPADAPPQYTGYAEATLTVAHDASIEVALELQDASSAAVTLNPIPHPQATHTQIFETWVSYGDTLTSASSDEDAATVTVPDGGVVFVAATSVTPTQQFGTVHRVAGPEDADITFPSTAPEFVSPASGATLDEHTEFVISGGEGGVTTHLFEFADRFLMFHTVRDRVTLSGLAQFDSSMTPDELLAWGFLHVSSVADIDAALDAPFGYAQLASMEMGSTTGGPAQPMTFTMPMKQRLFGADAEPSSFPRSFQFLEQ